MRITGGLVFDPEKGFVRRDVCMRGGVIVGADDDPGDGEVFDATGCYVLPGLTDIHCHGFCGADFSDGDAEGLHVMGAYALSRGITQFCPTAMTLPEARLADACRAAVSYAQAWDASPNGDAQSNSRVGETRATGEIEAGSNVSPNGDVSPDSSACARYARRVGSAGPEISPNGDACAELVGIHLEGPFLCAEKKGAQNGAWLREPDFDMLRRLQKIAAGRIRMVSIAPELPGALDFIRRVRAQTDIVVSLGHTAADYDTASAAFSAGANHVTHLFNAMPPLHHRAPGVIGAAQDDPACYVEVICDGIHLHPSILRMVFRLFGPARVVLISDAMRATGLRDGTYDLGGQAVTVRGSRATLADGTLAGSVTDLLSGLQNAVSFGIPLVDAVRAATVNPAKSIGIYARYGSLDAGKVANVLVVDRALQPRAVFLRGVFLLGGL